MELPHFQVTILLLVPPPQLSQLAIPQTITSRNHVRRKSLTSITAKGAGGRTWPYSMEKQREENPDEEQINAEEEKSDQTEKSPEVKKQSEEDSIV